MTSETKRRIERCYQEIAAICNYHDKELSHYERRQLNEAYYDLVDIFDTRRAEEFNNMMDGIFK